MLRVSAISALLLVSNILHAAPDPQQPASSNDETPRLFPLHWTDPGFKPTQFTSSDGPILEVEVDNDVNRLSVVLSGWYCDDGVKLTSLLNDIQKSIRILPKLNGLADAEFFDKTSAGKTVAGDVFSTAQPMSIEDVQAINKELADATVSSYFKDMKKDDALISLKFPSGAGAVRVIGRKCMSEKNLKIVLDQYRVAMLELEPAIIKYQNRVEIQDKTTEKRTLAKRRASLERLLKKELEKSGVVESRTPKSLSLNSQIKNVDLEINRINQEIKALQ